MKKTEAVNSVEKEVAELERRATAILFRGGCDHRGQEAYRTTEACRDRHRQRLLEANIQLFGLRPPTHSRKLR